MKTTFMILLMVIAKFACGQINSTKQLDDVQLKPEKFYPSLDLQYLYGVEINLIKTISEKFYQNIGIGTIGSVINRQTELLKIKYVIGYHIIPRVHVYSGLKTGWYYNQDSDYYYHFIGAESGLFIDLTKVEIGIKYTAGFDKEDFSKLVRGANYFVLRIPLYRKSKLKGGVG